MNLFVTHRTEYRYDAPKRSLVQSLRLWPSQFDGQDVRSWTIRIEGPPHERGAAFRDGSGDWIETVSMRDVTELAIVIEGEVETRNLTGVVRGLREKVPPEAYLRATEMTWLTQGLRDLAAEAVEGVDAPLDRAHALSRIVADRIVYTPGSTGAGTTAAQALDLGMGVCQDQTHGVIAVARAVGMPARYVVGYLYANADGTMEQASHAWAEIWVDGLGWVGFDAANRCCPDDKYIRLGSGLDAHAAAPVRGRSLGGGAEHLTVDVKVLDAEMHQRQQ